MASSASVDREGMAHRAQPYASSRQPISSRFRTHMRPTRLEDEAMPAGFNTPAVGEAFSAAAV
jgi:hypothetical protein